MSSMLMIKKIIENAVLLQRKIPEERGEQRVFVSKAFKPIKVK